MNEKVGFAGSFDSNDCLVTIKEANELTISIESIVKDYFYDQILKCVQDTLKEANAKNISVEIQDKGALDFTIRARVLTALARFNQGGNQ